MKKHKIVSLVLAALLLASSAFSGLGIVKAATATGTTENKTTAAYFLVKETSDGSWLTKYNYIHYITIGGKKYPAYCVESSRTNPLDGATYEQIEGSTMGYSATAFAGLQEIVRNGYPYASKINNTSLSDEQAQAATQMAIRMWLSYRKEQEGASYNVSGMYNPEPKAGNLRIKAGTVSGATNVYNAAIALYKLAKSGKTTTFTVAATGTGSVTFPSSTNDPYYRVHISVTMTGCDYAAFTGLPSDVTILSVSSGTKTQIKDGAVVTLQVPESYSGKTLSFGVAGYSNKGAAALQFYRSKNSPNGYQKLFVPVSTYASVTASGVTFPIPQESYGRLVIHKTDAETGTALSGAEFAFYVWSTNAGKYNLSSEFIILDTDDTGTYTLYNSAGDKVPIPYTTDNLGKIKVVETKAPEGYSNIDPATGKPYEWERQFTNDGEIHTITIDAVNERSEVDAFLCLYKENENASPLSGVKFNIYDDADCKTLLQTIVTNADGYAVSTAIPVLIGESRTVYVKELYQDGVYSGKYYLPDDTVYPVTLTEANTAANPARVGGKDFVIVNRLRVAYLELTKLRDDTGAPISGVQFQIAWNEKMEEIFQTITTDANGYAKSAAINIPAEGCMVYVQEAPKDGYVTNPTVYAVKLYSDKVAVVNDGPIYNTPTKVEISKTDIADGKELAGATLQIIDASGKVVDEWVTDGAPHVLNGVLIAGATYTLHEVTPPPGFAYAPDQTFTVGEDGYLDKLTMLDLITDVRISKQDITTGRELAGAKLQIIDTTTGKVVKEWTTDGAGTMVQAQLVAGRKYILKEISAPDGYVVAEEVEFTVSLDGSIDKVVMKDAPTVVKIRKISSGTNQPLAGAKLQVLDADGKVIESWTTDGDYHVIERKLVAGATYILHEVSAPAGHVVAPDKSFTVPTTAEPIEVVMKDEDTEIHVNKTDKNHQPLAGAKLQVIDKNAKVVEEWVSDGAAHVMKAQLVAGETYILHEVSAPAGYALADDITFTVSLDGTIDEVTMVDLHTEVWISKTSFVTGKELAGAKLQIIDTTNNKVVKAWTTNGSVTKIKAQLVAGRKYILKETAAPAGYVVANQVEFTVSSDGTIDRVTMVDEPTVIRIIKVSAEDNTPLAGAALQIIAMSGEVIDEWVSDGSCHEIKARLIAGQKYVLHEVSAPYGYLVAADVEFTVPMTGEALTVTMKDKGTSVKFHKLTADGTFLPGALIAIYNEDKEEVARFTTGLEEFELNKLPFGTYTMVELMPPEGFREADPITFQVDENSDGVKVVMIDQVIVQTGDESGAVRYTLLALLAAAALGLCVLLKKRNRE